MVSAGEEAWIDEDEFFVVDDGGMSSGSRTDIRRSWERVRNEDEHPGGDDGLCCYSHVGDRLPPHDWIASRHGGDDEETAVHRADLRNDGPEAVCQDSRHDRSSSGATIIDRATDVVDARGLHHRRHVARVSAGDAAFEDVLHRPKDVLVSAVATATVHAGADRDDGEEHRLNGFHRDGIARSRCPVGVLRWFVAEEPVDDATGEKGPFSGAGTAETDDGRLRRLASDELLDDFRRRWGSSRRPSLSAGAVSKRQPTGRGESDSFRMRATHRASRVKDEERRALLLGSCWALPAQETSNISRK